MVARQHSAGASLDPLLAALERAAISPAIPGEVAAWAEEVVERGQEVEDPLGGRCEEDRRLIAEIRRIDPELDSRCAQLEAECTALAELHARLRQTSLALLAAARHSGRDEVHLQEPLESVRRMAVDFVLRVRTLEAALAAWHSEALHRDRGPVD